MAIAAIAAHVLRQRKLCLLAMNSTHIWSVVCLFHYTINKGYHPTINFVYHKPSSPSDSLRFPKIHVDELRVTAFLCHLHHLLKSLILLLPSETIKRRTVWLSLQVTEIQNYSNN